MLGKKQVNCIGRGGVHKFSPRFTEIPAPASRVPRDLEFSGAASDLREIFVHKKYVGEVCEHCGKFLQYDNNEIEHNHKIANLTTINNDLKLTLQEIVEYCVDNDVDEIPRHMIGHVKRVIAKADI